MKIAHFAIFAPHASGQYGTVKDLILAERLNGIDAQFIDCGTDKEGTVREGLIDGEITTQSLEWALNADIVIRHTSVPDVVYRSKPIILALHGRPENSFNLDRFDKTPVITTLRNVIGNHKAAFTFWPEYVYLWQWISGKRIHYIPAMVNTNEFDIYGEKHDFGRFKGDINLIIADMWREDVSPFNLIFAAQYFQEKYYPKTKLHIFGAPLRKKCFGFLSLLQSKGVVGQAGGVVANIDRVYRSADILLTPNIIATRIVRESMASGLPMVAPHGCRYTPYKAEPRDYKAFALKIKECFEESNLQYRMDLRGKAINEFNLRKSGLAIKQLCEKVLTGKASPWNAMSINEQDWKVIESILDEYKIKKVVEFGSGISTSLMASKGLDVKSFETEKQRLSKDSILWDGKTILSIEGDMAFIDGPHGGRNREPSYQSVAESNIPLVLCHDNHRPEDRQWIDKYFGDWKVVKEIRTLIVLERP